MLIQSSRSSYSNRPSVAAKQPRVNSDAQAASEPQDRVVPPFKESAITSTIIGASVGTMVGEQVGQIGFVGATGYAGYMLGAALGNGPVGTAVGATAGYLLEKRLPIGKTLGGAAGFVSGGIVGGLSGVAIFGATSILNSDFFKKS